MPTDTLQTCMHQHIWCQRYRTCYHCRSVPELQATFDLTASNMVADRLARLSTYGYPLQYTAVDGRLNSMAVAVHCKAALCML